MCLPYQEADLPITITGMVTMNRVVHDSHVPPSPHVYSTIAGLPLLLIVLSSAVTFVACGGGTKNLGNQYLDRIGVRTYEFDADLVELNPELVVNRHAPSRIYVGFLTSSTDPSSRSMQTIQRISSASFVLLDDNGNVLDSLYTDDIKKSGIGGASTSTVASGGAEWVTGPTTPNTFNLVTILRTGDGGIWVRQARTTVPVLSNFDPVTLKLDIKREGTGLVFTLTATRNIVPGETEYLPSSETHRITIYDGPVKIWSSADGKMFTQAIQDVEPGKVGETATWEVTWDGRGSDGTPVSAGLYTIEGMIPAQPSEYYVREDYRWSGM